MPSRTVLITGCSSGIGHDAAHTLSARGFDVVASARGEADVESLRAEGLEALPLDLADSTSIGEAVEALRTRTSDRLYGLFNNGAFGLPAAVEDLDRDALRTQFEANLFGWVELTNRCLPIMRRQGFGRIVQNSSVLGFSVLPFRGAYCATKYALEALSDALRLELAGTRIYVSLIQPGPIATRFTHNSIAAFHRYVDPSASAHQAVYAELEAAITRRRRPTPGMRPAAAVTRKLIHALESPHPRTRYHVTYPTTLFAVMKRILPPALWYGFLRHVAAQDLNRRRGQ